MPARRSMRRFIDSGVHDLNSPPAWQSCVWSTKGGGGGGAGGVPPFFLPFCAPNHAPNLSALRISSPVARGAFAWPAAARCCAGRRAAEDEEAEEKEEEGDDRFDVPPAAATSAAAAESSGDESKARARRRWCATARRDMKRWRLLVSESDCRSTSTVIPASPMSTITVEYGTRHTSVVARGEIAAHHTSHAGIQSYTSTTPEHTSVLQYRRWGPPRRWGQKPGASSYMHSVRRTNDVSSASREWLPYQ